MSNSGNKIIIADTQFLVVEALKSLLENDERFSIIEIVSSCNELHKVLEKESFQLLITDFALFDFDSVDDLQKIKQKFPDLAVLVLTNSINKAEFNELSKIGIKNIIYKTSDRDEIFAAVDAALKGKKYFAEEILDMILEQGENKPIIEEGVQLTSSEIEIVRLIASGRTTKEIAHNKCISFHTVNTHRKNIFRKLGVSNASELIIHAIKSGWIDNIEYYI
ncbi:DNA-binding response regulator, LuxR family [Aquipluma nitroreducens]|jgi:DNA-binding NarL/FixJ family response regulator|uniref:DNA-binding response regulator, LuxR family n=1 Tax=Aquipluma nitroreducens TaxID=2010828 RepID=A0A5K7SEL8_9BACT|nr:response regulator transcription factor [Aquipluma nitroreducens]BBE19877.1 DNA-binding response regulator, LuxR family [Aquipluma nitroreducens]